jgi:hypothetical protein
MIREFFPGGYVEMSQRWRSCRGSKFFGNFETWLYGSRISLVRMNASRSRQALRAKGSEELRWPLGTIDILIPALAAILFWSLLLGIVSFCYGLWRLEQNWRLGISRCRFFRPAPSPTRPGNSIFGPHHTIPSAVPPKTPTKRITSSQPPDEERLPSPGWKTGSALEYSCAESHVTQDILTTRNHT